MWYWLYAVIRDEAHRRRPSSLTRRIQASDAADPHRRRSAAHGLAPKSTLGAALGGPLGERRRASPRCGLTLE